MELQARLLDPAQPVRLYGTTPPRFGTPTEAVELAAERLAERLAPLPIDGVVVYDIQDEAGRSSQPRPFPFVATLDPREYARRLAARVEKPVVTYKALGTLDEAGWRAWLDEARHDYGVRFLSVVGRPTSGVKYPMSLSRAIRLASMPELGLAVGAVVIAERHSELRSESARMLAKSLDGCRYFISQTVYHAPPTQALLRDYLRDCRGAGVEPSRVVLTFAPCGRERTLAFMRWLGVHVPAETERALFAAARPLAKSIEICRDNLRRILEQPYVDALPLGINVESVSIHRDEIDASVELFHELQAVLAQARR